MDAQLFCAPFRTFFIWDVPNSTFLDLSSIPVSIPLMPYTSDLLLLLMLFAWLRREFEMGEVSLYPVYPCFPLISCPAKMSEIHRKCLEEVQAISSATLFAPVLRIEAVQSMSASFKQYQLFCSSQ